MTPDFCLRPANSSDAAALASFAQRVFHQTFCDDPNHKPHDMAMFFANELSAGTLERELSQRLPGGASTYYLATGMRSGRSSEQIVGYIKLAADHAPDCVSFSHSLEIARLYVDFDWHKRGVAPALMAIALMRALEAGCDGLWLGVWHRNLRAQRFYEKWRFRQVGEHPFIFGTDHQTDLVFARPF